MRPWLFSLALLWAGAATADRLDHIQTYEWDIPTANGLSGLELSPDGTEFATISDRGWYLAGRLLREDGRITGIDLTTFLPILGNDGMPVSARRAGDWSDAEGLAIAPDGTHWISFERWARVARHAAPDATGEWIEDHPTFYDHSDNRQLEALALHPDGTLYTVPERPTADGFPIYALTEDRWAITGHLPEIDGFSIVGADFAPDGALYLLERKHLLAYWWKNRVRRVDLAQPDMSDILWTSSYGAFQNLEGIAIWGPEDAQRITLISDNNAREDEATQIVEFRLVAD